MVIFYWSDPTSTPVSCGSDSLEFFDVKWFLCACKLCPEIQPQIRHVLTCPHSLPSVLQSSIPGHDLIQLTLVHEVWLSSHLYFSLHIKRSPAFGPGSKTRRVRPVFVLCHSQIPPLSYFFLRLWRPVLQTAWVAALIVVISVLHETFNA